MYSKQILLSLNYYFSQSTNGLTTIANRQRCIFFQNIIGSHKSSRIHTIIKRIKSRLLNIVQKKNQQWTLWQSYQDKPYNDYLWGDYFAKYQENCQEIDKQQIETNESQLSEGPCRLCTWGCRKLVYSPWNQQSHGASQTFQNCPKCNLIFKENQYIKPTEEYLALQAIKQKKIDDILQDILVNQRKDWVEFDSWSHDGSTASWGNHYAKYDENCQELQGTKSNCVVCKREIGLIKNNVSDEQYMEYKTFSNCTVCKLAYTYKDFYYP